MRKLKRLKYKFVDDLKPNHRVTKRRYDVVSDQKGVSVLTLYAGERLHEWVDDIAVIRSDTHLRLVVVGYKYDIIRDPLPYNVAIDS